MSTPNFGDVEAAAVAIVHADTTTMTFTGVTVATDLVGYTAGGRWVRVVRSGGVPTRWMNVDNPTLALACYAEDKATAHDLANAARAALLSARGTYTGHGLTVFDVADLEGLTWSVDDALPSVGRYTFALQLVTRPA
jgi:hypothetical protein